MTAVQIGTITLPVMIDTIDHYAQFFSIASSGNTWGYVKPLADKWAWRLYYISEWNSAPTREAAIAAALDAMGAVAMEGGTP
jgi:hypothetical protein